MPSDFYNTIQRRHGFIDCCKSLRILSMLSLAVLRVPSSANKSHWTDARVRHRGKSLIKMQNRSGPRIDPWGTPLVTDISWEYVPFTSTHCRRSCKQDRKKAILAMLKLYVDSFFSKISWWTRSKALRKSRNTAPDIWRLLKAESQVSVKRVTAVWQECPHRKPDWKEWKSWCVSKKSVKCLWMCLSTGFVRTDRI